MVRFVPVVEEVQVAPTSLVMSARPLALAPVHGANERSVRGLYGERHGGSHGGALERSRSRPSIARSGRPAPGRAGVDEAPAFGGRRLSGQTRRGVGGPVPCGAPETASPPIPEGATGPMVPKVCDLWACRDSNAGPLASEAAQPFRQASAGDASAGNHSGGTALALARFERISPLPTHPALTSPDLLTVAEVARRLSVCEATVYGLVNRGELAHSRLLTNAIRIAPADLEAYLAARKSGGAPMMPRRTLPRRAPPRRPPVSPAVAFVRRLGPMPPPARKTRQRGAQGPSFAPSSAAPVAGFSLSPPRRPLSQFPLEPHDPRRRIRSARRARLVLPRRPRSRGPGIELRRDGCPPRGARQR